MRHARPRPVMDDFLTLIETLRERIMSHQSELRRNEALTRSVLIDPLLRALGWDTEDPAQVIPEFGIPSEPKKAADYALFAGGGVPMVIVEAKRLGDALAEAARQAGKYCTLDGYRYFAVTDGCHWTLYETLRAGPLDEKVVARFDLSSGPATEVCSIALNLWRQRFVGGGSAPVRGTQDHMVTAEERKVREPTSARATGAVARSSISPANQVDLPIDWISLSDLAPEAGDIPKELRLPSGAIVGVAGWSQLVLRLSEWLVEHNHLNEALLPIRTRGKRYLVAAQAKHSDGKPMTAPVRVGSFFVETHYGGSATANNMRRIVDAAGRLNGEFAVRMSLGQRGGT